MGKGSAPRKQRDDKAYETNWEIIFGRLGKRKQNSDKLTKQGDEGYFPARVAPGKQPPMP